MEQTLLTKDQIAILEEFKKDKILSTVFYLTGGTALSEFYLKHRLSDDLDFFTHKDFPQIEVEKFIESAKNKIGAEEVSYKKLYDRRIFFFKFSNREELKIEFSLYPFKQIEASKNIDNFFVDSLVDIATNKLMAMLDRIEPKDFFDLYFLIKDNFSLKDLRKNVEKKFGVKIDFLTLGSELAKIKNISLQSIKSMKPLNEAGIKKFFEGQIIFLREEVLGE